MIPEPGQFAPQTPTTLYLIRHGEVTPQLKHAFYGDMDVPLGERGLAQSKEVAERLAKVPFEVIYASPLERAVHLAELIAEPLDLPVRTLEMFRERNFGQFQGKTREELEAAFPEQFAAWQADRVFYRAPDAENFEDLESRVMAGLNELLAAFKGRRILLVCHAGPIRVILANILGLPLEHLFRLGVNLCSVHVAEFLPDGTQRLTLLNG